MNRVSWKKKTHTGLLFIVFLTSSLFVNFVHAAKLSPTSSTTKKLLNSTLLRINHSSNTSEVAEELPTPEALSFGLHGPHPNYLREQSYSERKNHPVILAQHEIEKYLKNNPEKADNYYRNRKGEWIYIVPEEEVLEKIDVYPSKPFGRRPSRNNQFSRQFHKTPNSYDVDSSIMHTRITRPVVTAPPPSYHHPEQPASFLARLLNTGNGFLRFLNPLTYFRSQEPASSLTSYYSKDKREFYRPKSSYTYPTSHRRRPTQPAYVRNRYKDIHSGLGNDPVLDDDFHHDDESFDKTLNSFDSDEYGYDNDFFENSETEVDHENNYEYENYVNHNIPKTSYPRGSIPKPSYPRRPIPKPTYPRTPLSYDSSSGETKDQNKESSSGSADLNNIYKFVDLEMLYDSHNMGSIENVRDKETLEYLQENNLRDDLYIGKDGNLYIKDSKEENPKMNRLGYQMYGLNRRVPVKRKAPLPNSEEKIIKRSTYKVINRSKNSRRLS